MGSLARHCHSIGTIERAQMVVLLGAVRLNPQRFTTCRYREVGSNIVYLFHVNS